ncbi:MAG: hypothetical protein QME40_07245, partial [bacterium]|nr:hypothetical protein [bacterium]
MTKNKISIFIIAHSQEGACEIIRLISPMKYMEREGLIKTTYLFWGNGYKNEDLSYLEDELRSSDIVVFQRSLSPEANLLFYEFLKKSNKIFVYETDDNLMETPSFHPGFVHHVVNKGILKKIIPTVDIVTTTTSKLADYLKGLNNSVCVLPNLIDPELFLQNRGINKEEDGKIVIGYVGSPT